MSGLTQRLATLLALTILGWPAAAGAQIASASLAGHVSDPSGAVVRDVTVTIVETSTDSRRVVVTNEDGVYTATLLPPGTYQVTMSKAGFAALTNEVVLATGATTRLEAVLRLAALDDRVTVRRVLPALRTEHASLGMLVGSEQLTSLPMNGRTFISLAALVPGVALPPNSLLPRINGGRPRTNEYLFDGISVLQPEPGQVAFFPVLDSIQEFRVETNSPPAEFGRFNGGVINLTTRSGTNTLHGTLFDYVRHDALNARNYFQSTSATKPTYRRQQAGGTVGGPLVRSRAFVYADYQEQRQGIGRTVISTVPTRLQRSGVFTEPVAGRVPTIYDPATGSERLAFDDNTIPADRIDPVAAALLLRYPLPTTPGTSNNYRRTGLERDDQRQASGRVDLVVNNRNRIMGRLTGHRGWFTPVTPLPDGSGSATGTLGPQRTQAWSFASNWQHTFSGTVLNDLRIGDTRRTVRRAAAETDPATVAAMESFEVPPFSRFRTALPAVQISGYQQLGSPANTATDFSTSVTQVADSITWGRGRHLVKAGFDLRWERLDIVQPPFPAGAFTFSSLFTDVPGAASTGQAFASFLLGQVQSFSIDLQRDPIQERAHVQEYFVQDDWSVNGRFTLNTGLRYTLNFPSIETYGQTAVFNLRTQQLEFPGRRPVRDLHKDNFGPRLGAVYRASDRTAVSAGYGLIWIEMAGITTPFTTPTFPFLQTVSQRTLDNLAPAFVLRDGPSIAATGLTPDAGLGQGVFAVDRSLGSGYVQQWNMSLQRTLSPRMSAEVAYVGSTITRVGIPDTNLNQLSTEQLALGPALTERVPNPYFGVIPRSSSLGDTTISVAQLLKPYPAYTTVSLYRNNVGRTFYQGVTASLRQRAAFGVTWSAAYTRSTLKDDASSVFDASVLTGPVANYPVADSFDRGRERDYSTGDIPHAFTAALSWEMPIGHSHAWNPGQLLGAVARDWSLAAVVTLQSGTPLAVTQATNFNAFAGFGVQRPNLVGDPTLPPGERTAARWFNTDAFAIAPQFTLGSASRNPVRGPGFRNMDLALTRRLPVRGRASFDFRVEVFNLLNTPHLGSPASVFGAPGFGSITTALEPRVIQLSGKLLF